MTPGFPQARPAFIGRYRIEKLLGKGGMGEVYQAFDPSLDRTIALKTIAPDADNPVFLDRLYREAKACGRLHHPHIVTVHDLGEIDGTVFIAMEYLQGEDLAAALKRGDFSFEEKINVLIQILEALQYAHSEGVIHRDIKPSNVHVMANKNIKLLDFGLARVARADSLTMSGAIMGTPYYMSPEQLKGQKVDGRTDVYSVGVVAYEMLTRRHVFEGDNITTVMLKVLSEPPAPMATMWSTTFPEIERIVMKALEKNADDRYPTAEDMKNALSAFLAASRNKVVSTQADLTVYAERAVIDARTLIAEGKVDAAQTLLVETLARHPDAEEARRLLDTQTQPVAPPEAPRGTVVAPRPAMSPAKTQAAAAARPADPQTARQQIDGEATSALGPGPASSSGKPAVWIGVAAAVVVLALVAYTLTRTPPAENTASTGASPASGVAPAGDAGSGVAQPATDSGAGAASASPATTAAPGVATGTAGTTGTTGTTAPDDKTTAGAAPAGQTAGRGAAPAAAAANPAARNSDAVGSSGAGAPKPAPTAKALFGSDDNAGLKYAIVQQKESKEIDVDSATTFHSGDKVRFNFETNIDGYLYVVTEGSSGRWTVLFPNPQINGGKNAVKRYERYAVPSQSWFVFDNTPGSENIFVFLSKTPMAQLPGFHEPVTKTETVAQSVVDDLKNRVRARDLILEKDANDAPAGGIPAPVTYVVNRDEVGQAVTATIQLNHAQ